MEVVVFDARPSCPHLTTRTCRSLEAAGVPATRVIHIGEPWPVLSPGPLLLVRAGAWLVHPGPLRSPPSPAAGRALVAVGHVHGNSPFAGAWASLFQVHGGSFPSPEALSAVVCEWFNEAAVAAGWPAWRLQAAKAPAMPVAQPRTVHWAALDAGHDPGVRCVQVVTSLQHGGAEKIAWELARELPRHGMATRLVSLGRPLRRTLPELPGTVNLSRFDRQQRRDRLARLSTHFGADVIHGHLVDAEDLRLFSSIGLPMATTIHNTREAWPTGLASLRSPDAGLLIACAQTVAQELEAVDSGIPIRTAWNGISLEDHQEVARHPPLSGEYIIACVANPRLQKRLHLLPAIVRATQDMLAKQGSTLRVRLILAGEASPRSTEAGRCYQEVAAEATRLGVSEHLTWTHGAIPVAEVYAQAHAAVSCSAYEGLSLAHLEALASGLPLVTSDAGGTRELAEGNPAVTLLSLEACPEDYARALIHALTHPATSGRAVVERHFSTRRLARRTTWLLGCLVRHHHQPPSRGVLFVTNNLSTGGAQSSLRRLAAAFHEKGVPVRVAVLEEHPESPTPGRIALQASGVPVLASPPVGRVDVPEAVTGLLEELAPHPPAAVVFWNVMPAAKVLLADALWMSRVHDVSPGEMFFSSLDRYFANPRPGLPVRSALQYGALLTGVVVKYHAEADKAAEFLGTKVQVIPNGVPQKRPRAPRGTMIVKRDRMIFGTAARISPQKRLEDLLAAFREALHSLPDAELRVAGGPEHNTGDYQVRLQAASADLPVVWLGEVQDMATFHETLDIFVMISEPAGCPNASLEALAAGLPVIATDVGGASEQVLPEKTGLLVPPGDPSALAAAMVRMAHDTRLRSQCAGAAQAHIAAHFSMQGMLDAYVKAFLPEGKS